MFKRLVWSVLLSLSLLLVACGDSEAATSEVTSQAVSWPLLRLGDSGRDVVTAQYLLRHQGQTLSVNGSFDAATEAAAANFQRERSLSADGLVGEQTWQALTTTVRKGDSNNAVRALQDQLQYQYGYGISVTGDFGDTTLARVQSFQTANCLSADGVVGPDTWAALVTGVGACSSARSALAQQIQASANISLWPYSPISSGSSDGADVATNIADTARGAKAKHSCYGTAPCSSAYLSEDMLQGILKVAESYSVRLTSVTGGSHSATSRHYAGTAFDIDLIGGVSVTARGGDSAVRGVMTLCSQAGATEVLGPTNEPQYHFNHIHCAW